MRHDITPAAIKTAHDRLVSAGRKATTSELARVLKCSITCIASRWTPPAKTANPLLPIAWTKFQVPAATLIDISRTTGIDRQTLKRHFLDMIRQRWLSEPTLRASWAYPYDLLEYKMVIALYDKGAKTVGDAYDMLHMLWMGRRPVNHKIIAAYMARSRAWRELSDAQRKEQVI